MDQELQIKYSKKQLRYGLVFSIIWIGIFMFYILFRPESYFGYGYLAMAIVFFAIYLHKKVYHYATIKNGVLTKHAIFSKRVHLKEITDVHYFAGKYTLQTAYSRITINTMEIDQNSLKDLRNILDNLNPKP